MSWLKSKFRMVAARASDALAQAADIVAPTLYESRVDEFHHRWTTVARFLETIMTRDLDEVEQRRQLLESHTRDSLQKLVLLIYAEENATDRADLARVYHNGADGDSDATHASSDQQQPDQAPRACLEYLLEHQIIPHLCEVGRRDQPCGIMSLSLQFVGALLSRVNHPILPTREVHVSVVALIQAATKREVDDPIVRKCLIILLNVLWKKLRCDPVQTEFFFLHADQRANTTNASGSHGLSDLVLFTGLLPHMYATQKTGEKCREALVIAASVHEPALCRFILKLTPFCHYAVNGVISAFDALPKTLPDKLRRSSAGTTSSNNGSSGNATTTAGGPSLDVQLQFLATRLRFCCTLVMVGQYELSAEEMEKAAGMDSQASISSEILAQFRTRFLEGPLLEALMHTSEDTARTATLYARIILEELAACCRDTNANPLLLLFLQFLVQPTLVSDPATRPEASTSAATATEPAAASERRLPMELMHRMDSLSSSLSIATVDLFTSLLELQNDFVDRTLLGSTATPTDVVSPSQRKASLGSMSPRMQMNNAIWLASRFPESAVAANAHVWKIQAFDTMASHVEIPVSSPNDSDTSEDQIVSLLSYIADAEFVTCQRAPAVLDGFWDSDDEDDVQLGGGEKTCSGADNSTAKPESEIPPLSNSSTSSRTAATRNAMKPLKEVSLTMSLPSYSPVPTALRDVNASMTTKGSSADSALFIRLVLNRLERVLESSFYENLALSGLISVLAQKNQCAPVVFDMEEVRGNGESTSFRAVLEEVHADAIRRTSRLANGHARLAEIRRKLVEENNEASLNDHEPETRLLCGYVVIEEILKELCSILFARDRMRSLPVKPEGYYLEPKRVSLPTSPRPPSSETLLNQAASKASGRLSIGQEFEQLIADAESTMGSILKSSTLDHEDPVAMVVGDGDA